MASGLEQKLFSLSAPQRRHHVYVGKDIVKNLSQLVLEPQSEIEVVRAKVRELGFHIEKEKFLTERGKFYFIIDAVPGRANSTGDEEFYDKYSKYLIEAKDTGYKEYVLKTYCFNI